MSSARGAEQTPALTSREAFGELRSLLAAPSAHTWDLLCDLFDRLERGPEREQARRELVPYALIGLERWPDRLRVAPPSWVRAVAEEAPTPAGLQLARAAVIDNEWWHAAQLKQLGRELGQVREARISMGARAGMALGALLAERRDQLNALELDRSAESVLNALLGPTGPTALTRLTLRDATLDAAALARLPAAPFMGTLRALTMKTPHGEGALLMRALCALPCARRLESLDLSDAPLDDAALRMRMRGAPATSLKRLSLRAHHLAPESMAALGAWIGRCEGLEDLALKGGMWRCDVAASQIECLMPRALRRLTIELSDHEDGDSDHEWAQALPAGLGELTLAGGYRGERMTDHVTAALRSPAAATLTALTIMRGALDSDALDELPALISLTLERIEIDPRPAAALARRLKLPAIKHLHIKQADASLNALRALAEAPWWAGLESLTFDGHGDTYGEEAVTPEQLGALLPASLTALALGRSALTAAHLDAILSSAAAPNLRTLSLDDCSLPAGSFVKIAEALPELKALERLSLRDAHHAKREDLLALAGCSAAHRLSRLSLGGVRRSPELHTALMSSPHLTLSVRDYMDEHKDPYRLHNDGDHTWQSWQW